MIILKLSVWISRESDSSDKKEILPRRLLFIIEREIDYENEVKDMYD